MECVIRARAQTRSAPARITAACTNTKNRCANIEPQTQETCTNSNINLDNSHDSTIAYTPNSPPQVTEMLDKEKEYYDGSYTPMPFVGDRALPVQVVVQIRPDGTMKFMICRDGGWLTDEDAPNECIDMSSPAGKRFSHTNDTRHVTSPNKVRRHMVPWNLGA